MAVDAPPAPPHPLFQVGAADLPESFDDDLGWILSKYVERTGARGGALTIHYDDGRTPEPVYAYGRPATDDALASGLAAIAEQSSLHDWRSEQASSSWQDLTVGSDGWRILSLPIASDAHQRLVMTTVHDGGDPAVLLPSEMMAQRLQPVLAGYFKLWLLNRAQRRRLDGLASALNSTDIAIMLLDGAGHIIFLNDAGRGLLDDVDGVRRVGRGFAATDPADAVKLRVAIEHVIASNRARSEAPSDARSPVVSLRRKGERRALIAAVLPVERAPANPSDPVAIVYVFTPDIDVGELLKPICQVYSLSPSEIRVAALLAEGNSVTEAAERMRVKVPTLRTYLKQIFAKTGTARQGDLIRLLMTSLIRTRSEAGHKFI
ncbi:DNA-binding CsgD family transcriptional regulator [Sphingomonas jejuensis]|uniref:DNA-binding CsgD family transcriptional regulator n=1 Tax=Sphingomonas jejuensis TaxID=904715 RepID=A0ABX0XJH8_9SPHN|nr:helix-turn-helix transcriptional regulator [Sphingomonas jejuensis]NJC33022.1 DNA-binding CsgD family transcriptional regulator [Sphingomonas jejuensis]